MLGNALQQREVGAVAAVPAVDGAVGKADGREGHHLVRIEIVAHPQTITGGAGPHGGVEGKQARFQLFQRIGAQRAGKAAAEDVLLAGIQIDGQHAAAGGFPANAQRGFQAFCQALLQICAHFDAVDHHVNIVLLVLVQRF